MTRSASGALEECAGAVVGVLAAATWSNDAAPGTGEPRVGSLARGVALRAAAMGLSGDAPRRTHMMAPRTAKPSAHTPTVALRLIDTIL
jgi:hypothetical protein